MSYIRKSFQDRSSNYLIDNRGYTATYAPPPKPDYSRGRFASNQKKYDYQSQINDSREYRPRTPSASQFQKNKQDYIFNISQSEFAHGVSQNKLKKVAKNYAAGIGTMNYGDVSINDKMGKNKYASRQQSIYEMEAERKQNIGRNTEIGLKSIEPKSMAPKERSFSKTKKGSEEEGIKDSFERVSEQKILQKITRINKLNLEINGRLQKILAKVSE